MYYNTLKNVNSCILLFGGYNKILFKDKSVVDEMTVKHFCVSEGVPSGYFDVVRD